MTERTSTLIEIAILAAVACAFGIYIASYAPDRVKDSIRGSLDTPFDGARAAVLARNAQNTRTFPLTKIRAFCLWPPNATGPATCYSQCETNGNVQPATTTWIAPVTMMHLELQVACP